MSLQAILDTHSAGIFCSNGVVNPLLLELVENRLISDVGVQVVCTGGLGSQGPRFLSIDQAHDAFLLGVRPSHLGCDGVRVR